MSTVPNTKLGASRFTYAQYRTWPENERWELIGGQAWNMSPAPTWGHQELLTILSRELGNFLKGKPCRPFVAPVDVFLPKPGSDPADLDSIDTIVQPDLGVVCNRANITPRGVIGAPDLIMEIISPSSVIRDLNVKKNLYARHGCREYWVWDTSVSWVSRFVRQPDGNWDEGITCDATQTIESILLPGFKLSLPEIRAEMDLKS